jgi:hypothetical protein
VKTSPSNGKSAATFELPLFGVGAILAEQAQNAPGDRTGWDWARSWDGYCLDWSDLTISAISQPPAA